VLASEAGTLHVDSAQIVRKGRLEPGTLLVVDTETGRVSAEGEAEADVAAEAPYGK
jgi:glutamate synthase (NADPH/NADH) large chain